MAGRTVIEDVVLIHSVADNTSRVVGNAKVQVLNLSTSTVQNIFATQDSSTPLTEIFTDSAGRFKLFVVPGQYKLKITKTGVIDREVEINASDILTTADIQGAVVDTASSQTISGAKIFGNYIELEEIADPANPTSPDNRARLYVRDNGSGNTQLVVIFPTGAVQVLATEP